MAQNTFYPVISYLEGFGSYDIYVKREDSTEENPYEFYFGSRPFYINRHIINPSDENYEAYIKNDRGEINEHI